MKHAEVRATTGCRAGKLSRGYLNRLMAKTAWNARQEMSCDSEETTFCTVSPYITVAQSKFFNCNLDNRLAGSEAGRRHSPSPVAAARSLPEKPGGSWLRGLEGCSKHLGQSATEICIVHIDFCVLVSILSASSCFDLSIQFRSHVRQIEKEL